MIICSKYHLTDCKTSNRMCLTIQGIIEIPEEEMTRLSTAKLVPGMPAEVYIQTGERSALSYLVKPLIDQLEKAFRESD